MNGATRWALVLSTVAGFAVGGWTLLKIHQIAERTATRPVSIDQIRELVLDALQQNGGSMLTTPVTGPDGRVHQVETRFRESGFEKEDDAAFIVRHFNRVKALEEFLEAGGGG